MKTHADDIVRLYRPTGEYRMLKPVASGISDIDLEKTIECLYRAAPPGILRGDVKVLPCEDGYVGIEFKSTARLKGFLETDDDWMVLNNVHVSSIFTRNSGHLIGSISLPEYVEYFSLELLLLPLLFQSKPFRPSTYLYKRALRYASINQFSRIAVRSLFILSYFELITLKDLYSEKKNLRKCFRRHFWAEMHRLDFHKQLEMLRVVRSLDLEV
jgi:hypothetical protein